MWGLHHLGFSLGTMMTWPDLDFSCSLPTLSVVLATTPLIILIYSCSLLLYLLSSDWPTWSLKEPYFGTLSFPLSLSSLLSYGMQILICQRVCGKWLTPLLIPQWWDMTVGPAQSHRLMIKIICLIDWPDIVMSKGGIEEIRINLMSQIEHQFGCGSNWLLPLCIGSRLCSALCP